MRLAVSEGSSRLGVLSGGPPLSLFVMFLVIKVGLGTYVPLVVRPLRWFFCLLGHESFHFVPCIPPFFFWVLWFIYDWQGFIIISFGYAKDGMMNVRGNVRDDCVCRFSTWSL